MTQYVAKRPTITLKQQLFIDAHTGDVAEASKKAGISYTYGRRLVTKPHIRDAIKKRNRSGISKRGAIIATREQRQGFWTSVLLGLEQQKVVTGQDAEGNDIIEEIPHKMADRLKASELLGRSEADFTDKLESKNPDFHSMMTLVADMFNQAKLLPAGEVIEIEHKPEGEKP